MCSDLTARKLITEISSHLLRGGDGLTFARSRLSSLQHHPQTIQTGDGSSQVQRFGLPTLKKEKRKRHKNGRRDLFGSPDVTSFSSGVIRQRCLQTPQVQNKPLAAGGLFFFRGWGRKE